MSSKVHIHLLSISGVFLSLCVLILYLTLPAANVTGRGHSATAYLADDSMATGSPFFGNGASRGYFYQSLLAAFRDRYVPAPVGDGRFQVGQPTKNNGSSPTTGRVKSERPAPSRPRPTNILTLLAGGTGIDPNIDTSSNQRKVEPDVVQMIGPVSQTKDLRNLPQVASVEESGEVPLRRHPPGDAAYFGQTALEPDPEMPYREVATPSAMPAPVLTFATIDAATGGCACLPPDTDGDVGPANYVAAENSSIRVYNKTGVPLAAATSYNSFFAPLAGTPCSNQNRGDGIVFYDHIANRWLVSDFAFPAFPGTSFWECIGVSQTGDPVAGGWFLYALQIDAANPTFLGDYPKFGLWPDGYYFSVNLFSNNTTFNGVRVFALDRNSMVAGGPANAIAFTIQPADLGNQYSLLPATYRLGNPPPPGQPEWFMDIDSPADGTTVLNTVYVRRFHADFATPANSTFGVGATHAPNGTIPVANFVDAFTNTGDTTIVPNGTATVSQALDTLGDKLMFPLVYQNRGGVESIWATHTVNNNLNGTGPTGIRWYQFNMTGNTIPAAPTQQQTFNNGNDGLWRWMPSLNVDKAGNMAIGYSVASSSIDPHIRYAGRLTSDVANTLAQGEATMITSGGHQTDTRGRWGDYSATYVDPVDGCSFYHTNEYYTATSLAGWATRAGVFVYPSCLTPTAATVTVSGRVLTPDGAGLKNAAVSIQDANGGIHTALTGSFGYYHFDQIEIGTYVLGVASKRFRYASSVLQVNDSLSNVDLYPIP